MSFKSSEINCSWISSTILKSPFCSSSCCQTCFPSTVRPILCLWKLIPKIILNSPEMNRSIFFSMYFLWVTKKMNHFLRNLVFGEGMFPWFNIDPLPSFHGNDSWWRASKFSSLWFLLLPLIGIQNLSHAVVTQILRADLQEFPAHCRRNSSQTCLIKPLHEIVDRSAVSFVLQFQQHSKILHPYKIYSICLVVIASQFVLHIVEIENFDMLGHHSPKKLLFWSHWARLLTPSQRVSPFFREGFHTLHTFLRLLRKDWAGLHKQLC